MLECILNRISLLQFPVYLKKWIIRLASKNWLRMELMEEKLVKNGINRRRTREEWN